MLNASKGPQTILCTGASGFLGRAVLSVLLERGHRVIALGRRPPEGIDCEFIFADLSVGLDDRLLPWRNLDVVVHLAASGVKASHRNWQDALAMNVVGTRLLLDAIGRSDRHPRFLMTRTFYEHLMQQSPPLWNNPYIATKAAAAKLVASWARDYAGSVSLGTVFQLFGPGDDDGNVLSYAKHQFQAGDPATFGSGQGLRDWLHVDDAAVALVAAIEQSITTRLTEIDIGSGELTSIRSVIEQLHQISGSGSELVFDASKDRPDVDLVLAARTLPVGWTPNISLSARLRQFYES